MLVVVEQLAVQDCMLTLQDHLRDAGDTLMMAYNSGTHTKVGYGWGHAYAAWAMLDLGIVC